MRRILLPTVASATVLAVAPATALARQHHGRHHHPRHAKVEKFGSDNGQTSASQSAPSEDTAGTVSSFTGGVLTVKLNDGSMVSGSVTDATEIECRASENATSHDHGGDTGEAAENESENEVAENENEPAAENQADNDNDDDTADNDENAQSCGTANLTPGTVVREAELRVSSAGSVWKNVELEM
jgi:hypothetical protein